MSDHEWKDLLDVVIEIAKKGGEKQDITDFGVTTTVWSYDDPWGGGLVLYYGEIHGSNRWRASAYNTNAGLTLLDAICRDGKVTLLKLDKTTAWELYLFACKADVEAKSD